MRVVDRFKVIQVDQVPPHTDVPCRSARRSFVDQQFDNRLVIPERRKRIAGGQLAKCFPSRGELIEQTENPFAGTQADFQFLWIKGLGDVVIGAGCEALYNIALGVFGRQQNDVGVRVVFCL